METQIGKATLGELMPIFIVIGILIIFIAFCIYMAIQTSRAKKAGKIQKESLCNSNKNKKRLSMFNPTRTLNQFGTNAITVDDENQLFIFGKKEKVNSSVIVYSFSDVLKYEMKEFGAKTVTKKKKGIGRAIVGGALAGPAGAIVGSATAKQETVTKGGTKILYICLDSDAGEKTVALTNPSLETIAFLEKCMKVSNEFNRFDNIQEDLEQVQFDDIREEVQQISSDADEIRKYKNLLDEGIITQEEFEVKKKQLLGL